MNLSTAFPADLVEAYRQLAQNRERDWLNPSPEAAWNYELASRAVRLHPFWRTLPDPAAVAEAARLLREISVLPSSVGGRRSTVRPLIVINELLETASARERLYVELGAESVYLLPTEVRAVLVDPDLGRWKPSSLLLTECSLWNNEP